MKILQKPKKSLGQNFLTDDNIIKKIIEIGKINKNSVVLEIGPGYGHLTEKIILLKPKKIIVVEKDKKLCAFLNKKFFNVNNLMIINQDFLETIKNFKFGKNITVFGNLPYNISTKILTSLITLKKWPPWFNILILMFQKEVADRIVAKNNTSEFSRLTVISNWRLQIKKYFDVSKNSFFPKPKINSTVLSFQPHQNNIFMLKDPQILELVTRVLFSNRRKMINKNFKQLFKNKSYDLKKLNINLNKRPGELTCEDYYKIAYFYEKLSS